MKKEYHKLIIAKAPSATQRNRIKKIFYVLLAAFVLRASLTANTEVNKEALFMNIAQKYQGMQENSGRFEIGMSMLENTMNKLLMWVRKDSFLLEKMALLEKANTLAMWIDFGLKTGSTADSVFNFEHLKTQRLWT